jgi:hypothetical protein
MSTTLLFTLTLIMAAGASLAPPPIPITFGNAVRHQWHTVVQRLLHSNGTQLLTVIAPSDHRQSRNEAFEPHTVLQNTITDHRSSPILGTRHSNPSLSYNTTSVRVLLME